MADVTESVAFRVSTPDGLASVEKFGRWCAEDALNECYRFLVDVRRFSRAAVVRRAEKDVVTDLAADQRLGFTHTDEQAHLWRERYVAGFVACWFDDAVRARLLAERRRRGFVMVCMR